MVMEVVQEDLGDGSMLCTDHPYKNSTPGGICAFCLQEKLGKLVSSSFPVAVFPSSSSSSSPSFRSEFAGSMNNMSMNMSSTRASDHVISCFHTPGVNREEYYPRRSKMPFVLPQRRRQQKKKEQDAASIVFKRSKSTAAPRRTGGIHNFLDGDSVDVDVDDFSPHKKGFWSFLYLSSKNSASLKKGSSHREFGSYPSSVSCVNGSGNVIGNGNGKGDMRPREKKREDLVVVEENESPNQAEFDRKVSRSRSVGCGSRSFSGDFFERISTGFGDCTLRRVESQREGKVKGGGHSLHRNSTGAGQDCIKERVKCGGIFGGFMITSSSSSSSSSSYLVSSSAEDNINGAGRSGSTPGSVRHLAHGRSRSWGWALASPMRAFSKTSSAKREGSSKNSIPNLSAIPSLLTVGG